MANETSTMNRRTITAFFDNRAQADAALVLLSHEVGDEGDSERDRV